MIFVAKPYVPGIHVGVRPGRRNLVKRALKGQNSHGVESIEPELSVMCGVEKEMGLPGSESQVFWGQGSPAVAPFPIKCSCVATDPKVS